jgi:hypothetical protein
MGDLEAEVDAAWAKASAESQQQSDQAQQARDLQMKQAVESVQEQFVGEVGPALAEQLGVQYQRMEEKGPFDVAVYFFRYDKEWRVVPGEWRQVSSSRPPAPQWIIQLRPLRPLHAKWQYRLGEEHGSAPTSLPGRLKSDLLWALGEVKNAPASDGSS